ncbi:GYD domain-containing protein [bacterium]|nr:GYD domain-containing protein [bacterium]
MEIYATFGRYDLVAISEFPNDETAMAASTTMSSCGAVHIETLKAFSEEEFKKIVKK